MLQVLDAVLLLVASGVSVDTVNVCCSCSCEER